MDISLSKEMGRMEVTILSIHGELDGQTFQELISKAKEAYASGSRDFLLDLAELTYISSAGLVALHSIALLVKGETLPDTDEGWSAYRSMKGTKEAGRQKHIKLLNPREEIKSVLEMVGFDGVFDIHTDRAEAVNSF